MRPAGAAHTRAAGRTGGGPASRACPPRRRTNRGACRTPRATSRPRRQSPCDGRRRSRASRTGNSDPASARRPLATRSTRRAASRGCEIAPGNGTARPGCGTPACRPRPACSIGRGRSRRSARRPSRAISAACAESAGAGAGSCSLRSRKRRRTSGGRVARSNFRARSTKRFSAAAKSACASAARISVSWVM